MRNFVVLHELDEIKKILGEEKYKECMNAAINKHTFNKELEVYWDYRDIDVFSDTIARKMADLELFETSKNNFETNKEKLIDTIYENMNYETGIDYVENEIRKSFNELAEKTLGDEVSVDASWDWFVDALYNEFDCTQNDGIKEHAESAEVMINLMIQYKDEANSDYSNIDAMNSLLTGYSHGYHCATICDGEMTEDDKYRFENNALSWLIYQQGYTMEDLVSGKDSKFLNSVRQEMSNMTNYMNELTVLLEVDAMDVLQMMSSDCHNVKLSKDLNSIGIFNRWDGGGSVLEIELEKDVILSPDMISHIQFEGAKKQFEYNVDEVYGLVGSCWAKDCMTFTDESAMKDFTIDYEMVKEELKKQGEIRMMEEIEATSPELDDQIRSAEDLKGNDSVESIVKEEMER